MREQIQETVPTEQKSQIQSARFVEQKNLISLPGIEPRIAQPRSLVPVPTTAPGLFSCATNFNPEYVLYFQRWRTETV